MTMDMNPERWVFMKPWWDQLREQIPSMAGEKNRQHVYSRYTALSITVSVTPSDKNSSEHYKAVREAMELVSLLALIDHNAWCSGISNILPYGLRFSAQRTPFHPPRFVLGVIAAVPVEDFDDDYLSRTTKLMREVMALLFAPLRLEERSSEYQKTRRQLMEGVKCLKLRHECETMKVPLVMGTSFWHSDLYEPFQAEVDAIFNAQSQRDLTKTQESAQCVFVLEGLAVDFDFTGDRRNADRLGAQLAKRQVPLQEIRISEVDKGGSIARGALTGPSFGLEISLHGLFNHESDRVAVCSKIAAMPAVTSAELHLMTDQLAGVDPQTSRERTLQWLAFAYLSPFSMNSITRVDITFNGFSARDAAAIMDVMNSSNPLQLLVNSSESDCQIACVIEQEELVEETTNNSEILLPGTNVWIVHNRPNEPTVEVLVPELGVRTIKRSNLSVDSNITPSSSVTELIITIFEADYEGGDENRDFGSLVPLLEAVGANVTTLAVEMEDETMELPATTIPGILRACPRLKFLALRHFDDNGIDCFVEAYETGDCQIECLDLDGIVMTGSDSLDRIFQELKDPERRISQRLRELHIRTSSPSSWLAREIRSVLDVNRSLHTVIVSAPTENLDETNRLLQDQEPVYMSIPSQPYPLQSKLAFLSVLYDVDSSSRPSVCEALTVLNKTMYQQIFDYAATPMLRVVYAVVDSSPIQ